MFAPHWPEVRNQLRLQLHQKVGGCHYRAPQIDLLEGRRRGKGIRRCVVFKIRAASKATDTAWRLRFRSSAPAENQNPHAIISRGRLLPPRRTTRFSFLRHVRLRHWLLCKPRDASYEQHRAGVRDGGGTGRRVVARAAAWLTEGVDEPGDGLK